MPAKPAPRGPKRSTTAAMKRRQRWFSIGNELSNAVSWLISRQGMAWEYPHDERYQLELAEAKERYVKAERRFYRYFPEMKPPWA